MTHVNPDSSQSIRVLLADDHPLIREALVGVLSRQPDIEVLGAADNGEDAVRLVCELLPHVVILDLSMPKLDGIGAIESIRSRCPRVAILVLTMHDDYEHIRRALEVGATGYLTKDAMGDQVVQAVRSAASGDVVLSQSVLRKVFKHPGAPVEEAPPPYADLTEREFVVLKLAARGLSNNDIALQLGLSPRTVRGHLEELFSKLNVAGRTEAVAVALRAGLISISDLG